MATKTKNYDLATAARWAEKISAELAPLCERVEVAGSIRRGGGRGLHSGRPAQWSPGRRILCRLYPDRFLPQRYPHDELGQHSAMPHRTEGVQCPPRSARAAARSLLGAIPGDMPRPRGGRLGHRGGYIPRPGHGLEAARGARLKHLPGMIKAGKARRLQPPSDEQHSSQ